jgi:hypothetical protein
MQNKHLLISRYLDGELTDAEIGQLAAVLETNVVSVDQLVVNSFIHAQLLNWMDQRTELIHDGTSVFEGNELYGTTGLSAISPSVDERHNVSLNRTQKFFAPAPRRLFSLGSLAAILLIAASVSLVAYLISSRPVIVGQLTDATGCQWGGSPLDIRVGTLLENGQDLCLIQGRAVITFASGAKVLLEGPTTVRLNSPNEMLLIDGNIASKVPRPAIGFTVKSSLARFVDLGTAFTLMLHAEKSFELHVFEGLVELQLDERFGATVHQPVYVAAVHAQKFYVQDGDVEAMTFEEGKKMPF